MKIITTNKKIANKKITKLSALKSLLSKREEDLEKILCDSCQNIETIIDFSIFGSVAIFGETQF